MPKRAKTRQSLAEILASCSDALFPAEMGKADVTINSQDCEGDTPLHVMLWRGDTYGARCLIDAGAPIDIAGDMSETPLHVAVKKDNVAIATLLLEKGANPNALSEFGTTPRSLAADQSEQMRKLFR